MDVYIYRIDKNDLIIYVVDNWLKFAQENGAADSCHPDIVINRPIWDFIADNETIHLYKIILNKVRTEDHSVNIPCRCDSPDMRRFLDLEIVPLSKGTVEFKSTFIKMEKRKPLKVLKGDVKRPEEFIRMCSMCKMIAATERDWLEVEDAIVSMKLFEKSKLPQITHGICPKCYAVVYAQLDKPESNNS